MSVFEITSEDIRRKTLIAEQKLVIKKALEEIGKLCDEGADYWHSILSEVEGSPAEDKIFKILRENYQGEIISMKDLDSSGYGGLWYEGEWFYSGY